MLKFEHIPVGHEIRAYDFEPVGDYRDELYVEGEVVRHDEVHGAKVLVITCNCDSGNSVYPRNGRKQLTRVGAEVFVPMEMAMMEWDERVIDLTEGAGEFPILESIQQKKDFEREQYKLCDEEDEKDSKFYHPNNPNCDPGWWDDGSMTNPDQEK